MYNKFIKKDGEVLLDLTDDSISASDLLQGVTAHDKSGEVVEGSIPIKTSEDLTVNGAMVTVPKGYYAGSVTKSVATASQATPSITVDSNGLITATATQYAGYVASGTKSATKQLTAQAAKTITPSKSTQTAVASGVYTTGAVTVGAIPSNYIIPSGTKTITANGTHDVKNYASATVNVAGEDVTSETNAYTTKLATLETAITALETELQGKASGGSGSGGSVETCTITINGIESYMAILTVGATRCVDGAIAPYYYSHNTNSLYTLTIENVVCDSILYINGLNEGNTHGQAFNVDGGCSMLDDKFIQAPSESNALGTVRITPLA